MFRIEDGKDITDKEFDEIVVPFDNNVNQYIIDNIISDYVAFYIASGYERNAIWTSNLKTEYRTALENLSDLNSLNAFDSNKIKNILKVRYSLELTNEDPLEIKKIQY